jgi:hypothetical protein
LGKIVYIAMTMIMACALIGFGGSLLTIVVWPLIPVGLVPWSFGYMVLFALMDFAVFAVAGYLAYEVNS